MSEKVTCGLLSGAVDPATGEVCEGAAVSPSGYSWCVDGQIVVCRTNGHPYNKIGFCPACGSRLSFTPDGTPVATAQVSATESRKAVAEGEASLAAAAVEWLEEAAGGNDMAALHPELEEYLADLSPGFAAALAAAKEES